MNYSFIDTLKNDYRVTELQHAFRINGVIDIWKNGNKIYDIVANKYIDPVSPIDLEKIANSLLLKYPEKEDFKKGKNGISYQEFKNTIHLQKYQYDSVQPEDYHWGQFNLNTSKDHLYFAIIEDKVKIGRSKNPKGRMSEMSTAMFKKPKVYVFNNKGFMETKLHHIFSDFRLHGEWFTFDLRIQHFLKKHHSDKTGYILWPTTKKDKSNGKQERTT